MKKGTKLNLIIGGSVLAFGVILWVSWQFFASLNHAGEIGTGQFRVLTERMPTATVQIDNEQISVTAKNLPSKVNSNYQIALRQAENGRFDTKETPLTSFSSSTKEVSTELNQNVEEINPGDRIVIGFQERPDNDPKTVLQGELNQNLTANLRLLGFNDQAIDNIDLDLSYFPEATLDEVDEFRSRSQTQTRRAGDRVRFKIEGAVKNLPEIQPDLTYRYIVSDSEFNLFLHDIMSSQNRPFRFQEPPSFNSGDWGFLLTADNLAQTEQSRIERLNTFVVIIPLDSTGDTFIPIIAKRFRL